MILTTNFKKKPFFLFKLNQIKLIKFLFYMFVCGLVYGAMLSFLNFNEISKSFEFYVNQFLNNRFCNSIYLTVLVSFLNYSILIFSFFLLGFIPISQPLIIITPTFYGLGLGVIVSYLIIVKKIYGIFICLFNILPCSLLSAIILLLSCKESCKFANKNFEFLILRHQNFKYSQQLKIYIYKFLTLLLFQFLSALFELLFVYLFLKLYK